MVDRLYAVSAPGLEIYTAQELRGLGISISSPAAKRGTDRSDRDGGGVEFTGEREAVYRANLWLRTASRVLVRLGEFYAAAFSELRKKAGRLEWERYLVPGQPVALRVTCHKSRLYHSDAVAERVVGAIGDRFGQAPPFHKLAFQGADEDHSHLNVPDRITLGKCLDPSEQHRLPQLIVVRLVHDQCTISVDSSGELLHRRGYRLAATKAPLRETLAAGMLMASGWDQASPLVDPFCGSGTIAIEAALMRRGIAPGRQRRFAFMDWPDFDWAQWEALLANAQGQERSPLPEARILASDRDAGAIAAAQANADRAGVAGDILFTCQSVSDAIAAIQSTAGIGWVVTNPPYGLRISENKDLRNLYAQFGKVLRANCPGWRLAMLCSDERLARHTSLRLETGLSMVNGGVAVKLARGIVEN